MKNEGMTASISSNNIPSIKLPEKLGFFNTHELPSFGGLNFGSDETMQILLADSIDQPPIFGWHTISCEFVPPCHLCSIMKAPPMWTAPENI